MEVVRLTKRVGDEGLEFAEFQGYLATFDNVDLGGDRIRKGAFKKSLTENPEVPLLWQHWPEELLGKLVDIREDEKGLKVRGVLNLAVEKAREAYALLRQGALSGMSIGYDSIKDKMDGDVRELLEIKLWEGSLVTFPMNQEARIEG